MADNNELLIGENGLLRDTANKDQNLDGCFCHIGCIFCGSSMSSVVESAKVLPCLHVACQSCLIQFLTDKSVLLCEDGDFCSMVFSCPQCSYVIQLPHNGVGGLKSASFLQSSHVVVPRCAAVLSSGEDKPTLSTQQRCTVVTKSAGGDNVSLCLDTLPSMDSETGPCRTTASSAVCSVSCSQVNSIGVEVDLTSASWSSDCDGRLHSVQGDHVDSVRSKLTHLSADAVHRQQQCQQAIRQTQLTASDLDARRTTVHDAVGRRADDLCRLICSRRDQLFDELDREHALCAAEYSKQIDALEAYSRSLANSQQFADALLSAGDGPDDVHGEVIARMNQLLVSDVVRTQTGDGAPELTAIRLDVPDMQHEESHLEKLFGGLVKGTLSTVELLMFFNTELQWPTGFVVTNGRESVLAGKTGAFADEGEVLFCDRNGVCIHRHSLASSHLPVDVAAIASGEVIVSDVSGQITKFGPDGRLVEEWKDVFQGTSGHLAVCGSGDEVLVSSASECCIHRHRSVDGHRVATLSLDWPNTTLTTTPDVTAIAVNSAGEIIVTASNVKGPCFFSANGQFLRSCSHDEVVRTHSDNGLCPAQIALPSAVCCDSFDNVLVADFLGNCVHLVSHRGVYLGQLLTKTHGVACPNFVTLDHEGRLYVGQYGGDVLVFQYLSYVKHV